MGILKALLARACIPLCFIQILKFESGQLMPSDIIFLHILMMFTTFWIYGIVSEEQRLDSTHVSRMLGGAFFITNMILAVSLSRKIFQKGNETRKYILIDYGFPCLDFNQLLQWTCYEIWYLMFFIYSYLKAIGLGPVKLVCYLFYLSMHAIVVCFIMDLIYQFIITECYFVLLDNFFYTFDANSTKAYPEGYLDPRAIETGSYDKSKVNTETYTCTFGSLGECFLTVREEDYASAEYPYKHTMLFRYTGEDVEMVCAYGLETTSIAKAKVHPTLWYFNERMIVNSSRYIISNNYHSIGQHVHVFSSLKIRLLKGIDFGEYFCSIARETSLHLVLNESGDLEEKYKVWKPTLNVFKLNQIDTKVNLIYRIVGNLITSENFFWYHTDDDIYDISISYTINDRPVEELCPGFQTHVCSLGASILRRFIRLGAQAFEWDGLTQFPFIEIGEIPNAGIKRGILYFCLCSAGYGVHRISFLRRIYTGIRHGYRNEEVAHPFVFVVLPLSKLSLFRLTDDSHLYANIEHLIQNETNLDVIEQEVNHIIAFVQANEDKVLTLANAVQTVMFIILVITFYIMTFYVSNWYLNLFIQYVPRFVFIPQRMLPEAEPVLAIEPEQYDVFLSHSEEEYIFVTETLVPFLEHDCELRVCLPDRDFPPNKSFFGSYVDRIWKSRKVIVILSQAYMAEARCRYLQLEHIILPLLYQELRAQKDILIIKFEEMAVLPDPLRWNFQIEVFHWYRQLPARVKLRTLKKLVLTGHI